MSAMANGPAPGSVEEQAVKALLEVMRNANSPEIVQAQALMLRRLALQGDVVGSRVPAPRNITEIGGYLNLLADLKQQETRDQMLAGILGVAGPAPDLGFTPSGPPVGWVSLANDRPAGPAQGTIPVNIQIRGDFVAGLRLALQGLHDQGCALP